MENIQAEGEQMYCIGCGRPLARMKKGQTLAISCSCGALSPILVSQKNNNVFDQIFAFPASIQESLGNGTISHLEYYLGFSDHESKAKTWIRQLLRSMGSISYTECFDADCRRIYDHQKEQYENWKKDAR